MTFIMRGDTLLGSGLEPRVQESNRRVLWALWASMCPPGRVCGVREEMVRPLTLVLGMEQKQRAQQKTVIFT